MSLRGRIPLLGVAAVLVAACSSGGATTAPVTEAPVSVAPASQAASEAPASEAPATPIAGGLLEKVLTAGKIVMSTDPQYPPQSSITSDGTFEGFDIDVGTEIAKRLGVEIGFETPDWNLLTAGSWGGRWDFSVGSMTITTPREKVLAFSKPYYYTPAGDRGCGGFAGRRFARSLAGRGDADRCLRDRRRRRSTARTRSDEHGGDADRVLAATNHELAEQSRLRATEDFKEGVKATAQRRVGATSKGR